MTKNRFVMGDYEPINFSHKTTKRLIQMVQTRPCLWDRQAMDYKDRISRDKAWAEIFMELDPSFKDRSSTVKHEIGISITKKWYNIRDAYVKSLKPDYFGRRNRRYIHASLLRFLDDCYLDKMNTSLMEKIQVRQEVQGEEKEYAEEEAQEEAEPWEHKVFVSLEEEEPRSKIPKQESNPEETFNDSTKAKDEEDIISILSNLIQKEEDEDRAFFKSITPSVKKLSENAKLSFRIEVLQLIKNLRAKDSDRIESKEGESSSGSESE